MRTVHFTIVLSLLSLISVVVGHARIKYPRPLAAADDSPGGNYYNNPLKPDGSNFPCKGLHKQAAVDKRPTATWQAGQQAHFEILGHGASGGEGSMAAHSGGSCQASLSFDNGDTWKVLHTYIGGCPRGARMGSNIAGKNQTFTFKVPENTKAGNALFSWSWIAVTGNRNEYYQNCASVLIAGSGTSTLDDLADMFVGDMTLAGQIGPGECRSSARYALEYPQPGKASTFVEVPGIQFKKPTGGKCFTKASTNNGTTSVSPSPTTSATFPSPAATTTITSRTTSVSSTVSTASSTSTFPTASVTMPMSTRSTSPDELPSECSSYMLIIDRTRHSSYPGHIGCDNTIFKNESTWVRFSGGAGTRLVTEPAEPFHCGTQGAGWYSGTYPTVSGATTSGTVCYSWPGNSCRWSNSISITNCKDYYVFALRTPPGCFLRYCTI